MNAHLDLSDLRRILFPGAILTVFLAVPPALAQGPDLGPPQTLPGDDLRLQAVEEQARPDLAAGSNGFLAVWTEARTSGLRSLDVTDVFAARLDSAGELLDPEPILVSTADHKQLAPRVAWNGSSYLVVYRTERATELYLEEDLVAVRITPDGTILDGQPIVVAADVDNLIGDPDVTADGSGWAVVWPQFDAAGIRGVRGARVTADGVVLDPGGTPVWYDGHNTYATGVRIAWNGIHYLVVWTRSTNDFVGLRLDSGLEAVEAQPFSIGLGLDAEVAAGGGDFYAVFVHAVNGNQAEARGARISGDGQVLDPGGVSLSTLMFFSDFSPAVAWNGSGWTTAFADDGTGSNNFDLDLALRRVGTDGVPIGASPTPVDVGEGAPAQPQVAPRAGGGVQLVWESQVEAGNPTDVSAAVVGTDGVPGDHVEVSVGLPRQTSAFVSDSGAAGGRLLLYRSQSSGTTRVLGQRMDATGAVLDAEPVELFSGREILPIQKPQAAWNGSIWLVVWQDEGGVRGRRFDSSLGALDPQPFLILDNHEDPAIAALGSTFLVAGAEMHYFNEPQRWLSTVRVGSDGTILDAEPALVSAGFEKNPRVAALGGRWLLVWESQVRHDVSASTIDLAWIEADGVSQGYGIVSGSGYGDAPDLGLRGDGAFLVWHDNATQGADLEGRSVSADGTLGPILTLVAEPNGQVVPRIDRHGDGWLLVWLDGRHLEGLDEARPDVWAARLDAAGSVLDPGGFPVAVTPRWELDAEVAAFGDTSLLLWSGHPDTAPAGLRLITRSVTPPLPPEIFSDGFETGSWSRWSVAQ